MIVKKLLSFLLVGLMLFAVVGGVMAEGADDFAKKSNEERTALKISERPDKPHKRPFKAKRKSKLKLEQMKEFRDEKHKMNELKIERLKLETQEVEKHDILLDLYLEARENGKSEALKEAKEVKRQIMEINKEIKDLHVQLRKEEKEFRKDLKKGDLDSAKEHLNKIIEIKASINEKVSERIVVLDEIIDILS